MSQSARVLVVDDEADHREILRFRLGRMGISRIAEAGDGAAARDLLEAEPFDLVLLDLTMPGMGGVALLEWLKADPQRRDIPVIVVSALSELESTVRCLELGAEDRLPKPFDPAILKARVTASLERKRLRDAERAHLAQIEQERRRADELLHAIMPAEAVAELKATGRVRPRRFDDVTVLLADVVDFTAFCDSRPPEEVVRNIEDLVERFEAMAERFGLEPIKSVGDAVLATANLLRPHADGPLAALRCAFAMQEAAAALPAPWRIRAGIHQGPLVAGVVGRRRLSFDLWGDTLNVAARLAAFGQGPGIYVTEQVWQRLARRARGERLGPVPIKGKGEILLWRCEAVLAEEVAAAPS
jgi:class 3 adenylate cyclase